MVDGNCFVISIYSNNFDRVVGWADFFIYAFVNNFGVDLNNSRISEHANEFKGGERFLYFGFCYDHDWRWVVNILSKIEGEDWLVFT